MFVRHASMKFKIRNVVVAWLIAVTALFATNVSAQESGASEFLGGRGMPYDAFDRLPHTAISVGGATLQLGIAPGQLALSPERIRVWVEHSANVVSHFYGHFPVMSARILIVPVNGNGVRGGTTWAYRGAAIRLLIGSNANENDLENDWMIVHEMVHLALPDMDERHRWLSEGLATYIEPIARVQSHDLTESTIWSAMARDMQKGLPAAGDRGLNNTPTWGRTYWGGALFCLLADVQIRQQTGNRFGLQDALRGVLAGGGNHETDWTADRIFEVADKAIGTSVLTKLYAQMGEKPFAPDLDKLWRDLGVTSQSDGNVVFDDNAPLAAIRKAITQGNKTK
jgi:hypothetical protein